MNQNEFVDRFVTQYERRLLSAATFLYEGNADKARDLVQTVYLKAWRAADKFRGDSSEYTWLTRILMNEFNSNVRGAYARRHLDVGDFDKAMEARPDDGPDPFVIVNRTELEGVVGDALTKIPPKYRVAVALRDIEELSYEDIAGTLGLAMGTVKSQVNRGRRALTEEIPYSVARADVLTGPGRSRRGLSSHRLEECNAA